MHTELIEREATDKIVARLTAQELWMAMIRHNVKTPGLNRLPWIKRDRPAAERALVEKVNQKRGFA